ncbi:hypothetical protein BDV3_000571 [Batrachochytrium dendrobatidis]|uniref:Uncharacterized protein n=1 Tax=Batrachochytrium dendrobatidis (strain JEL423) TaxID=403673 RepID=A0A177WBW8_BATDL|nr:hypothetical protein BDEG_21602 [Batrachochytrium dendrobatidis JEL423]
MACSTHAMEIVPDGGIIKLPLLTNTVSSPIEWTRGSNAKLHYIVHAYISPTHEKELLEANHHSHDSNCTHSNDSVMTDKSEMFQKLVASINTTKKKKVSCNTNSPNPISRLSWSNSTAAPDSTPDALPPVRRKICDSRDHTDSADPFELRIGYDFSVKALELCVKSMSVGERARFLCMPEYCQGFVQLETVQRQERLNRANIAKGLPPVRSGAGCCAHASAEIMDTNKDLMLLYGAPLEFEIELVQVQSPNSFVKEPWEMTSLEKYHQIPQCKQDGGVLYKKGDFTGALQKYERALILLESLDTSSVVTDMRREKVESARRAKSGVVSDCTDDDTPETREIDLDTLSMLMQSCRLNYAACKLKLNDSPAAIIQCTQVLASDPNCIKALFRRAQAYTRLGRDLDLADQDLKTLERVLESHPEQYLTGGSEWTEYTRERMQLNAKLKQHAIKEKKMYGKMFECQPTLSN